MEKSTSYENYPAWIILLYNVAAVSVYSAGIYLLYQVHPWLGLLFFIYILFLEDSVYREGCVSCYYYGKWCAMGRGKIVPLIHKKDDPKKFCEKEVNVKKIIPQFLVSIIPAIAGAYLLIQNFDLRILGIALWPLVVSFLGNPIIYGKLACPRCKQREICCPACDFFGGVEKSENEKRDKNQIA